MLTLVEHLGELRNRIIKSAVAVIVAMAIMYSYAGKIIPVLIKPLGKAVFTQPQEAFVAHILIAFFCGIVLCSPILLYQIWSFIAQGLTQKEKKALLIYIPMSLILFIGGVAFGYLIIVPLGIRFLLGFASLVVVPMVTISNYISFVGMLSLTFGLVFQLPLVCFFLTVTGLATPKFLSEKRKHAIAIIFIAAAIITPPDVVTQCLMAVPLVVLYELGVVFSRLAYRKKEGDHN